MTPAPSSAPVCVPRTGKPHPPPPPPLRLPRRRSALKIALCYAAAGVLWILGSDWVLHHLVPEAARETVSLLKGWLYVAVTALLLGWALDRYFTRLRRSARMLQESEARGKHALEGAAQAVWDWNPQTHEVHYSPEWKALLGYAPHELGHTLAEWETRVHPDDLARVKEEVQRLLAGQPYASEHRLRCRDGSYKWILDRGQVTHRTPEGKPLRVVGTHADIHRRKQAEERNRAQHDLMQALAATHQLEDGLRLCLEAALKADGLTGGGFYLADPKCGALTLRAHSGLTPEFTQATAQFQAESPQGRLAAAGAPVYAEFEELRLNQSEVELREGLHSIAILPIRNQGQLLGCLNVASHTHDEIPAPARLALETIAATAGEAIARLHAQEALRESESNFRTFFQTIDDLIIVATPEGQIVFGNAAVERKLGFQARELAGMTVAELHPPAVRAEAGEILGAMFRGERKSCPLPLARKDSQLLPVETRVWFGQWNGQQCLFGLCKDLSAEQEAQQRFERLFRHNPMPMALTSLPDHRFADVNDAWLEVLGYERGEVMGKTSQDLNLFPLPELQQQSAATLQETGTLGDVELQVRTKSGAIREGRFSGEVLHSQGKSYSLTVMLDVTERKRAEDALRRSEEKHRGIFDESVASIYVFDNEKHFLNSNQAGLDLLGYSREELLCLSIPDVDADPAVVLSAHQQLRSGGRLVNYEHNLRRKDGTIITVLNNSRPLTDAQGNVIGMQSTLIDITERRQAESALRESEAHYRLLAENTEDFVAVLDAQENRVYISPSFYRVTGWSPEEVLQSSWDARLHPEDLPAIKRSRAANLAARRL